MVQAIVALVAALGLAALDLVSAPVAAPVLEPVAPVEVAAEGHDH